MRRYVHNTALIVIAALMVVSFGGIPVVSSLSESDSFQTGPYVDEVIFKVIANQDQRILALQSGEIEMDTRFFDPLYLPQLDADPDIDIFTALRNGYGHISINCRDYPLNISGLRRAFAFAFDKTAVTDAFDGFSQEHDSVVPYPNGWCVEDEFDWHYYTNQSDIGNQILDDLNFTIDSETGFRLAPNGSSFEIVFEYSGGGSSYLIDDICIEALHSLHINAETRVADFNEYMSRLDSHGDYDMAFYTENFYSNDVDWLAYEYWSEYADVYGENPSNFVNETYDGWRDQLLHSSSYEEVYEASAEMQKILHYNVPRLVIYENTYMQGYRNDQFTGHIEDLGKYISGPWTMRKIQKINGSLGGTVPIATSSDFNSFNFLTMQASFSASHTALILDNLYSSLYKRGPDLNPQFDLAESMLTETHSDNAAVPDGHTRFTIDIVQNATWSDGTPLTADDIAFTFIYQLESAVYGNPAGTDIGDLIATYAPNSSRVVLEFNTESYWHFSDFAFDYIIPKHIFNDADGIGYEGWSTWNPVLDPADPHVTCGPFIFTDYEVGDYYKIEANPLFHYAIDSSGLITNTTSTTVSTTTTGNTNQSTVPEINWPLTISSVVGGVSSVIILYCSVQIFHERRKLKSE